MSSESLAQAVARNSNWINTVISNSKLSSQLSELVSITSLDQKIVVQEGVLDAKYANVKSIRGYKGLWNATTNIPTLSNSSGVVGDVYKVSVAGNINIGSGSIYYVVGDLIYLSEDNWIKISPNQISDITGLQLALDSLAGGLIPQGNWNALSNVPDIGTGATTGQFWIVSVAGSTNVGGITDWEVNDWAVRTATGWAKIDNTDKVLSVAGRTGVIVLGITDITGLTAELANTVKLTGNQSIAGQKTFTELVTMTDRLKLSDSAANTLIGDGVGTSLTTGAFNVGVGRNVLQDTTVGSYNVGLGDWALYQNTEGSNNFAGGDFTLWTNSTGSFNVAIGHEASRINSTGSFNVAIGSEASKTNTTGENNIGIGKESLWNNRTGSHNIGVGLQAGKYIANGVGDNRIPQKSIFIGQDTRANADGQTNQIVIGDTAIGNGSNTVTLGNNSIATTYLKGDVNITGSITGGGGDFLPLSGGTLTGALTGTSASFTGSVTAGSLLTIKGASPYIQWQNVAGTRLGYIQHNSNDLIYNADVGIHKFNQNATFTNRVGIGATELYTTTTDLNLSGKGVSFKNDINGASDNWSYIYNTATASQSNLVFAVGASLTALTLSHSANATFAGDVAINNGKFLKLQRSSGNLSTQAIGIPAGSDSVRFFTTGEFDFVNGSLVNILKIGNTGNATFAGNVSAGTGDIAMDASSSGQLEIQGSGYRGAIALDATAMRIYHNSSSRDLVLGTNETARLTINGSNGNAAFSANVTLGAGLSRPCTYDGYGGNFKITPNAGGWASGYFFNQSDGTYRGGFGALGGTNTLQYFWIGDDYNDASMVVYPNGGNVGIGTDSPNSLLTIGGNGVSTLKPTVIFTDETNGGSLVLRGQSPILAFDKTGTGVPKILMDTGGVQFKTGTLDAEGDIDMVILPNGNVGIGTDSPIGKLYVGQTWNTSSGGNDLYVKSTVVDNNSYDPQISNTTNLGITMVTDSATTTGPDSIGLTLYNDDGTAGGFSPMLLFAKLETPSSQYKASMAGIYARSPLGTGNNDSWIDGELIFATAGAASQGIKQRMVINKEGLVGVGTNAPVRILHLDANGGLPIIQLDKGGDKIFNVGTGTSANDDDNTILQMFDEGIEKIRLFTVGHSFFNGGFVGIGTTSPSELLHLKSGTGTSTDIGLEESGIGWRLRNDQQANDFILSSVTGTFNSFVSRLVVKQNGNLLIGVPSISDATSRSYGNAFAGSSANGNWTSWGSGSHTHAIFRNGTNIVGTITTSGSATTYNTSSDYRLKEDLQDFGGLDMISKIPVYDFKWKTDESRTYGVMAHELQEVLPDAVRGEKDAEEMQGVDYSKIVPLLIKSIQELKSEIEILKAK